MPKQRQQEHNFWSWKAGGVVYDVAGPAKPSSKPVVETWEWSSVPCSDFGI